MTTAPGMRLGYNHLGGKRVERAPSCNHVVPALQASPAALAKCVLAEVPRQVVEYYSHKELPPRGISTHTHEACPQRLGQPGVQPVSVSSTLEVP